MRAGERTTKAINELLIAPRKSTLQPLILVYYSTTPTRGAANAFFADESDNQESRWIVGWNGSGQRGGSTPTQPKAKAKKPSPVRGLVAGFVVVALAFVAYFAFFSGSEKPQTEKPSRDSGRIKEVKSVKVKSAGLTDREGLAEKRPRFTYKGVEIPTEGKDDNKDAKPPIEVVEIGSSNRTFKSGLEQVLCNLFSIEVGDMPPPLPMIPDSELDEVPVILATICQESETDDELKKYRKQVVNLAKKELRNYLKEGGDFDEFLQHYHNEMNKAFFEQKKCQRQVEDVCANEDPEVAVAYYKKVNEDLLAKGIKPVELPDDFAEKHGIKKEDEE